LSLLKVGIFDISADILIIIRVIGFQVNINPRNSIPLNYNIKNVDAVFNQEITGKSINHYQGAI
jgi:hypothetical protein